MKPSQFTKEWIIGILRDQEGGAGSTCAANRRQQRNLLQMEAAGSVPCQIRRTRKRVEPATTQRVARVREAEPPFLPWGRMGALERTVWLVL